MNCKDCIHYDVCGGYTLTDLDKDVFHYAIEGRADEIPDIEERCGGFKDKSRYIELPCKVGDKMYFVCGYNIAEYEIYKIEYDLTFFKLYGENSNYVIEHREFVCLYPNTSRTIFFFKEEAEKALAKMKGGE